jgi:hypothetical protein
VKQWWIYSEVTINSDAPSFPAAGSNLSSTGSCVDSINLWWIHRFGQLLEIICDHLHGLSDLISDSANSEILTGAELLMVWWRCQFNRGRLIITFFEPPLSQWLGHFPVRKLACNHLTPLRYFPPIKVLW